MKLLNYLVKHKVVTGPLEKNSSNSHCGRVLNDLLGIPQFVGDEKFLRVGRAVHEIYYQDIWDTFKELTSKEQAQVMAMLTALKAHPVAKRLRAGALCEDKVYGELFGVKMAYILDAHQVGQKIGSDLKTTSCTTWLDCKESCINYGYVKQALIYKRLAKLKEFYFVFINKQPPHPIFIVSSKEFKAHEKIAEAELEMVLWFYKTFGNIIV